MEHLYRITIEDTEDNKNTFTWYGTVGTISDLLSHESLNTPITDGKTGNSFIIKDVVLKSLKLNNPENTPT